MYVFAVLCPGAMRPERSELQSILQCLAVPESAPEERTAKKESCDHRAATSMPVTKDRGDNGPFLLRDDLVFSPSTDVNRPFPEDYSSLETIFVLLAFQCGLRRGF